MGSSITRSLGLGLIVAACATVLGFSMAGILPWGGPPAAHAETVKVYASPQCGCCGDWVDHLERHGFEVDTRYTDDLQAIKREHGIDRRLEACHTALVDGYLVEGHVPADEIRRLLDERPAVRGLAVPGMPHGSPGMEGLRNEAYQVLQFTKEGELSVFSHRYGGDHL